MSKRGSVLVDRRCDSFFTVARTKDFVMYVEGEDYYFLSYSISCDFFFH